MAATPAWSCPKVIDLPDCVEAACRHAPGCFDQHRQRRAVLDIASCASPWREGSDGHRSSFTTKSRQRPAWGCLPAGNTVAAPPSVRSKPARRRWTRPAAFRAARARRIVRWLPCRLVTNRSFYRRSGTPWAVSARRDTWVWFGRVGTHAASGRWDGTGLVRPNPCCRSSSRRGCRRRAAEAGLDHSRRGLSGSVRLGVESAWRSTIGETGYSNLCRISIATTAEDPSRNTVARVPRGAGLKDRAADRSRTSPSRCLVTRLPSPALPAGLPDPPRGACR